MITESEEFKILEQTKQIRNNVTESCKEILGKVEPDTVEFYTKMMIQNNMTKSEIEDKIKKESDQIAVIRNNVTESCKEILGKVEPDTVEFYTKMMHQNNMIISEIEDEIKKESDPVRVIRNNVTESCKKLLGKVEPDTVEFYTKMMHQNNMIISEIEDEIKKESDQIAVIENTVTESCKKLLGKVEPDTVEFYTKMMIQNNMTKSEIEDEIKKEFNPVAVIRNTIIECNKKILSRVIEYKKKKELDQIIVARNNVTKFCKKLIGKVEPDTVEFYTRMMIQNNMTKSEIEDKIKHSPKFEFDHLIKKKDLDLPLLTRMENDWDERAKANPKWFVRTEDDETDEQFWKSGELAVRQILKEPPEIISKNNSKNLTRVLEIGCGIGRILMPMGKFFDEVNGVDVSSEMIKLAKRNLSSIPNCKLYHNNGKDLIDFIDNSIDFCYSVATFQHIPDKKIIKNYFNEVYRVLKNDSYFRFQVNGTSNETDGTTWNGVSFSKDEIIELAKISKFKIFEMRHMGDFYFTVTFQK